MPFLTNDPLPQCLQASSDIALSPPIGNKRGCGRYLLEVKCLQRDRSADHGQRAARGQDTGHTPQIPVRPLASSSISAAAPPGKSMASYHKEVYAEGDCMTKSASSKGLIAERDSILADIQRDKRE